MADFITGLPSEMMLNICRFLPGRSLKALRLVNRHWEATCADGLWKTLRTDLYETVSKDLNALLTSRPSGFRNTVTELHITGKTLNRNTLNFHIMHLLAAIPKERLTKVTIDYETDERTLGALIRLHPGLKNMSVPLTGKNNTAPPGAAYVAGNVDNMKTMEIFVNQDQNGYDVWLDHLSKDFERLSVNGRLRQHASVFAPWTAKPRLLHLTSLHLENLNLAPLSGHIEVWTKLSDLVLAIRDCNNLTVFLENMHAHCLEKGELKIRELILSNTESASYWINELDLLLSMFADLEFLYTSASTGELVEPNMLLMHARSLFYLMQDTLQVMDEDAIRDDMDDNGEFSVTRWLPKVADNLTRIQELGISITHFDFKEDWGHLDPWEWPSPSDEPGVEVEYLMKALDKIALFRNLRVLRLTHPPFDVMSFDEPEDNWQEKKWRHDQFAEQILRYLVCKGSPIQVLAFSPVSRAPPPEESIGSP